MEVKKVCECDTVARWYLKNNKHCQPGPYLMAVIYVDSTFMYLHSAYLYLSYFAERFYHSEISASMMM